MIKTYGQTPKRLFDRPHPMVSQKFVAHQTSQATSNPNPPLKNNSFYCGVDNYSGGGIEPAAASAAQQQQQHIKRHVSKVVDSVDGLQWGSYIGSPSESEPIVIWKAKQETSLSKLISVYSGGIFGVPKFSTVAVLYNRDESNGSNKNPSSVSGSFLLQWNQPDGIIRAKLKKSDIAEPLLSFESMLMG